MDHLNNLRGRLFKPQPEPRNVIGIILWWESRRFAYNGIVLACGFVSFLGLLFFTSTSGLLRCGDDAFEPIALFFAPVMINICYTVGWIIECAAFLIKPLRNHIRGPILMRIGLCFSLFVIFVPTVFWGGLWAYEVVTGHKNAVPVRDGCQ